MCLEQLMQHMHISVIAAVILLILLISAVKYNIKKGEGVHPFASQPETCPSKTQVHRVGSQSMNGTHSLVIRLVGESWCTPGLQHPHGSSLTTHQPPLCSASSPGPPGLSPTSSRTQRSSLGPRRAATTQPWTAALSWQCQARLVPSKSVAL